MWMSILTTRRFLTRPDASSVSPRQMPPYNGKNYLASATRTFDCCRYSMLRSNLSGIALALLYSSWSWESCGEKGYGA
jgi:hypothetical protein